MKKKHVFNFSLAVLCVFSSCCEEENINDSFLNKERIVTTRSDSHEPIEWGRVRCIISLTDRTAEIDWNCPTGEDSNYGMLFEIYSTTYGYIGGFETTSSAQMVGQTRIELSDRYTFSPYDNLYLQVRGGRITEPIRVDIKSEGGILIGESAPRCNHRLDYNYLYNYMSLTADLSGGEIIGTLGIANTKPCRFIMKYTYYDIILEQAYTEYLSHDLASTDYTVRIPWDGASKILAHNATSISCELRVYFLYCNRGIPNSDCGFHDSQDKCSNYLHANFTLSRDHAQYRFPYYLEESK